MTYYFCLAIDQNHPSRRLDVKDEPICIFEILPEYWCDSTHVRFRKLCKKHEIHSELLDSSRRSRLCDEDLLFSLQAYLLTEGWLEMLEMVMEVVQDYGSLIHHLARLGYVWSLRWLIKTCGIWGREVRDHNGWTHREALEASMEEERFYQRKEFKELEAKRVLCLLILEGKNELDEEVVGWEARGSRFMR